MYENPAYIFGTWENSSKRNSDILTMEANNMSPVALFKDFFAECICDIIQKTNEYVHKIKINHHLTKDEIKVFIAFLLLLCCYVLSREWDY